MLASKGQAVASPWHIRAGGMPGQASVELISILGISLVVILVFSVLSSDFLSSIGVSRNYADARDSVQKLVNAADLVYAQGEGASAVVLVKIPADSNLSSTLSYIGKPSNAAGSVASTVINLRVGSSDVLAVAKETVSGSWPQVSGTYYMRAESKGSYVAIGTHYLDSSKNSVYQSMAPGESRSESITFSAVGNESVTVTISQSWGYNGSVNMNITGGNPISISAGGTASRSVNFAAGASAGGLYNSVLTVNATAANGVSEIFTIPITADVQG